MNIVIERLEQEIHEGDWHDKPSRWVVKGPDNEIQRFSTKKDATIYRRCRLKAKDFNEASKLYSASFTY